MEQEQNPTLATSTGEKKTEIVGSISKKKLRKRCPIGMSLVNPSLKRRKIPRGVDFAAFEREELKETLLKLKKCKEDLDKEHKIIFEANLRRTSLREEMEKLEEKKLDLQTVVDHMDTFQKSK